MTNETPRPLGRRKYCSWRIADVDEGERYAYFREAVCEAFMDLSPEFDGTGPFDAMVESIPLAQGAVNRVSGTPHHVRRTRAQIARSSEQCYFLNIQLASECVIEQRDHSVRLAPGQVALFPSDEAFRIFHPPDADMSVASFWLPRGLVEEALPGGAPPPICRVSDHPFLGPPIAAAARTLNRGARTLDADEGGLLLESLVRLVAKASVRCGGSDPGSARPAMLAAVLEHVESRLDDPALSVGSVAARFGVSLRYLHKLFEPTGESFCRYLLRRRLEQAASELTAPEQARTPIAEIAFRNGFSDLSWFNRRFKAQFGATPRDVRHAVRDPHRGLPSMHPLREYSG